MKKLRVLIADDEEPARRKISALVEAQPNCELIAQAKNGQEALQQITQAEPDIAFLDISMPMLSGMEVARQVQHSKTRIVFVTAYDRFAVDAFAAQAADYLLKPINNERFAQCIARLVQGLSEPAENTSLSPTGTENSKEEIKQLGIRHGSATRIVDIEHIIWLEATTGYCLIHLNTAGQHVHGQAILITDASLAQVAALLPSANYLRIHRATVINTSYVVRHWTRERRMFITLRDVTDREFRVSRSHAAQVRSLWPAF